MVKHATFNGIHNLSKSRLLLFLHMAAAGGNPGPRSAIEINWEVPNLSLNYLYSRLTELDKWGYINKEPVVKDGRLVWGYVQAKRGDHFIKNRIPYHVFKNLAAEFIELMPNWERYLNKMLEDKALEEDIEDAIDTGTGRVVTDEELEEETNQDEEPEDEEEDEEAYLNDPDNLPSYIVWPSRDKYLVWDWRTDREPFTVNELFGLSDIEKVSTPTAAKNIVAVYKHYVKRGYVNTPIEAE